MSEAQKPTAEKPPEAVKISTPQEAAQYAQGGGIEALTKAINAQVGGGDIYKTLGDFYPKPDDPTLPTKTDLSNGITVAEKILHQIDVSQVICTHQYGFQSRVLNAIKNGMLIYPISRDRKGRMEAGDILSLRMFNELKKELKEGTIDRLFRVRSDNKG